MIHYKYNKHVVGIEIQEEIMNLAKDSICVNNMQDDIQLIHDSVLNLEKYFLGNTFDIILCNPPYYKYHCESHVNENILKRLARHEVTITLEEILRMASVLLKDKGRFYMVHVPDRIDEICVYASKYGMAVKELQFIYSRLDSKPIIVLVTLVKSAKFGTKVYSPICIKNLETYQNIFRKR